MKALILVDIQNDFVPGGALAVPEGDKVVAIANRLMPQFDLVVATQDWHPAGHGSFASTHSRAVGEMIDLNGVPQILWPDHCVQGTRGAEFVPGLNVAGIDEVVRKGSDVGVDSYSGFFDNGRQKATGLESLLRRRGVEEVYVMGLATDYCVKATAIDAASLGFKTTLILEGSRGVNLKPGDVAKAVEEMKAAGVRVSSADDVSGVLKQAED